ncbi:hypothetical protein HDU67_007006 [Dinochytrium kinnereticum]|nr:hypothetical protein HDU67_007006 [Dinochytrium kinnereticum]
MTTSAHLTITVLVVGPLQCNCIIISDLKAKEAIIVDPGGDPKTILNSLELLNVSVKGLYHSHAHLDHCLATTRIKAETGAKVHVHKEDLYLWQHSEEQARYIGVRMAPEDVPSEPDVLLSGDEDICLGGQVVGRVMHTPGHSPGSVSFYIFDHVVCTGDTLFRDSVGRFDLWRSSFTSLKSSIKKKLYTLPPSTPVIPGHGPHTTIERERESNQFIRAVDDEYMPSAVTDEGMHEEDEGVVGEEEEEEDEEDNDDGIEDVYDDDDYLEGRSSGTSPASCMCCTRMVGFSLPRL